MFTHPTVFVVGAGASCEFDLPSGATLKQDIGNALNFNRGNDGLLIGDRAFYEMLGNRFRDRVAAYFSAADELSSLIRATKFESIDEVLHWFSDRVEIVELGKVMIARQVLQAERKSFLARSQNNPSLPPRFSNDDKIWVSHLLSMATGGLSKAQITMAFENVTIINFNYDRTIEHYLHSQLRSQLGIAPEQAKATLFGLKMIRPYGSLGHLPWHTEAGVEFGANIQDYDGLARIADNVFTYTEQQFSRELSENIESSLIGARIIVFLGFGFHQQNLNILSARDRVGAKQVLATVVGIDPENYVNLESKLGPQLDATVRPHLLPRTAAELLLTMRPTILDPARTHL